MKEIKRFRNCSSEKGAEACFREKLNIMEICPEHVLSGLREKKKWYLRAAAIDNQTYKRAMTVSDYNKGRSVSDLKLKSWGYGSAQNMRTDSYWQDDRYDPKKYRHYHRKDSVNFPDMEYKDIFGGTLGDAERADKAKYALSYWSGKSKAVQERHAAKASERRNGNGNGHNGNGHNGNGKGHAH